MGSSSHVIEETTPANLSTVKQLKDKSLTHKLWLILVISTVSGDIFKRRESTASMNSLLLVCVLVVGASAFPQSQSGCGADERGAPRQPGDNWQEACNRCRCLASGRPGCTRKFCGDFPSLGRCLFLSLFPCVGTSEQLPCLQLSQWSPRETTLALWQLQVSTFQGVSSSPGTLLSLIRTPTQGPPCSLLTRRGT